MKRNDIERKLHQFSILSDYYLSDDSIPAFALKKGISRRGMYQMIRKFEESNPELSIHMKKKVFTPIAKDAELIALKREVMKLKKELEKEKFRAHAYDTMIDVAEEMFNIPIRKKAGTEQ